jgi:diguanylate cyclase (GGDEF)-like protein/PAS domain S-box-containing protein
MWVMRRFESPVRIPSSTLAATAIATFGGIFAFRLFTDDAAEPVMFLMVVPISLLAAEYGLTGGVVGAGVASALLVAWNLIGNPDLSTFGYSSRFLVFFLTGLTVGFLSSSRKQIETESSRWFEQSADLNCVADFGGNLVRVNRAFEKTLGYSARDILNRPYAEFVHPDDHEKTIAIAGLLVEGQEELVGFENRYRTADGTYRSLRWTAASDPTRKLIYATALDVTETKELEDRLRDLAQTDALTGIFNRRYFEEESRRQLEFVQRYGAGAALFVFDIDDFKRINDSLGHSAGDEALKKVAASMASRVRKTDICARIGGDEFAILFPGVRRQQAEILALALLDSIRSQRIGSSNGSNGITSSIGIAMFDPTRAVGLEVLIAAADEAMYVAKRRGGDSFELSEGLGSSATSA